MTVRELITELMKYDMNAEVIVTRYDGGSSNEYARVATVNGGQFTPDVGTSGHAYDSGRFTADKYTSPGGFGGTAAVIILPND